MSASASSLRRWRRSLGRSLRTYWTRRERCGDRRSAPTTLFWWSSVPDAPAGERGPGEHCCQTMAEQLTMDCTRHESPYECADQLLTFIPKFREYGLIVHDGGESFV